MFNQPPGYRESSVELTGYPLIHTNNFFKYKLRNFPDNTQYNFIINRQFWIWWEINNFPAFWDEIFISPDYPCTLTYLKSWLPFDCFYGIASFHSINTLTPNKGIVVSDSKLQLNQTRPFQMCLLLLYMGPLATVLICKWLSGLAGFLMYTQHLNVRRYSNLKRKLVDR